MTATTVTLGLLWIAISARGHMQLLSPPGINSKYDPQTPQDDIDYSMTDPLFSDGSNYPCKGYNTVRPPSSGDETACAFSHVQKRPRTQG